MNMKKNPFSLHVNVDDFLPATDEEKAYMVQMRPSSTFFKDGVKRLVKNKVAHGQLRHGFCGCTRRIAHGNTAGPGVVHIDVVHTDAAPDHQLQPPGSGFVQMGPADLRLRSDHHRIKAAQCRAQAV